MRRIERAEHRLVKAALHEIVAPPVGEIRKAADRRLGIGKHVRLVRALVDRRAADFRKANRLAFRHPGGRRLQFLAIDTLVVRRRPPVPEILGAENPGLAERIGNRRAVCARRASSVLIIEVVEFARAQIAAQIAAVVNRVRQRRIEMRAAVAPVGKRRVIVDADKVDIVVRPERIERKAHLLRRAVHIVRAIFAPVGGIGNFRFAADN
jgi:hypothetical protein